MKKAILAILTLFALNTSAQQTVNTDDFNAKFEPEKNHVYIFAIGTLFTALGANGLLQENKTNDQKFQNYSAIGVGLGMITGSVVFDIGQEKQKRKFVDP